MSFLENLKRKSPEAKSRYAFVGALLITLGIGLIWTTTLPARFGAISTSFKSEDMGGTANVKEGLNAFIQGIEETSSDTSLREGVSDERQDYVLEPPQGALGSLSGWDGTTTTGTTTVSLKTVEVGKIEIEKVPEGGSPVSQIEPSPTTTEIVKPTVILIGTTTKKTE